MTQTVLMVDDDEAFLEEMSEVLRSSGYQAVTVRNPLEAVETAKKARPNLVLMDLKMPEKSGFRLASEFKGQAELSAIPIIAMSGIFQEKTASLPGLSGFRKCLPKPFSPLDVIWMIEKVLSEGERRVAVPIPINRSVAEIGAVQSNRWEEKRKVWTDQETGESGTRKEDSSKGEILGGL